MKTGAVAQASTQPREQRAVLLTCVADFGHLNLAPLIRRMLLALTGIVSALGVLFCSVNAEVTGVCVACSARSSQAPVTCLDTCGPFRCLQPGRAADVSGWQRSCSTRFPHVNARIKSRCLPAAAKNHFLFALYFLHIAYSCILYTFTK